MDTLNTLLSQPWPYLVNAAFAVVMSWYAWRRPHRPDTYYFQWITIVWVGYQLTAILLVLSPPGQIRYGLWVLLSVITLFLVSMELLVALEYTGNEKWLTRRSLFLLFLPAILLAMMAYLRPEILAVVDSQSGYPGLVVPSLWKWGFYSFVLIMYLIRVALLLTYLIRTSAFQAPILLLILSQIVPLAAYTIIDPQQLTVSPILVPAFFGIFYMLTYFVVLYVFHFLQVIPVARDQILLNIPYSLIVLDAENRIVDFNATAQQLPGLPGRLSLKQSGPQALDGWWDRFSPLMKMQPFAQDAVVTTDTGKRIYHIVSIPLLQASGWRMGRVFLIEDVTQQRHEQGMLATLQERELLARELHDSVGQVLGFASLKLGTVRKLMADGNLASADDQLAHLENIMAESHADVREYILNLRTAPSEEKPFFSALRQYLDGFRKNYDIRVELSVTRGVDEDIIDPGAQIQLFHILQEALSNARRHAGTDCVRISFERQDSLLCMRVRDQGKGFDPILAAGMGGNHFGLQFMRERAEQMNGTLRVQSTPGEGTCIEVKVPVNGEEPEHACANC